MDTFENLVDMFDKSTKKFAKNPLFGTKENGAYVWMTYAEVAQDVADLRGGLAMLGVGKDVKVAMIANNRPEWAVAAYATYGLGAQYVPMYEQQLEKEWTYILEDCGAKVLFVANDDIYARTKGFVTQIATLDHVINLNGTDSAATSYKGLLDAGRAKPRVATQPHPDDLCGFIYTSGTTGKPKGVLLSHDNITSNINAIHAVFPMHETDRSLSFLPWAHSFGQTVELHSMLSYGASMGLAESAATIIENLPEVQPTLLFSVPRIFNKIYDSLHKRMNEAGGLKLKLFNAMLATADAKRAGQGGFWLNAKHKVLDTLVASKVRAVLGGNLRYAFSGGAALSKEVGTFIDNLGIMVYEGYGLTETSPICTANTPEHREIGSVGKAIPGVTVRLIPCEGAPEGQGEIVVSGPNVMRGYHNLPEETAKVLDADGSFHTGDMGRIDDRGFVYITGRVKEQYKLENGKYVVPSPLEEKLRLSAYIANVMIDGSNRPYNVALVVPEFDTLRGWAKGQGLTEASDIALAGDPKVLALIEAEVATYGASFKAFERPRKVALIADDFTTENGMLTPSLKVKRRIVMAAHGEKLAGLYS